MYLLHDLHEAPTPFSFLVRSRSRRRRDVKGSDRPRGHTTANRAVRNRDADLLAVVRLVRDPARGLGHIAASGDLDADAARRAAGADDHDRDASVDVPERRALDAGAAAAGDADGAGAHEARPVGEGPQALRHLVVVRRLLVDADHLLVGRGRRPLHALPVQVPRDVVADERAVDVVGLGEAFSRAAVLVPGRRPLTL